MGFEGGAERKKTQESVPAKTEHIYIVANDGSLVPTEVVMKELRMNPDSGRPEMVFQTVNDPFGTEYTAEWKGIRGTEGWMARPLD